MSDPTVTAFLTKLLCSHGGRLPRQLLPEFLELPTEQIEQILQDEPQKFTMVGELVLARNPVRICAKYLKNEQEEECDKLHLCRHYLQGKCWSSRRRQCNLSHDFLSDHNRSVLKANEIIGLNEEELKVLLFQNDHQLLPEVCVKYLHDTCDLGKDCTRLHICGFFTRGECNRRICKRSHHLLEVSSDLLLNRCRMSEVSIQNFQMLCAVKHSERLQSLREEGKRENERGRPAVHRGRGRPRNKQKREPEGVSRDKSRGRQNERAESNIRRRSVSRPISEGGRSNLGWSGDDGDEPRLDKIKDDWFNDSYLYVADTSPSNVQPLMSCIARYPTSTVSISPALELSKSHLQFPLPAASPTVPSAQPGSQTGLSTPSFTPSAPQPKSAITPVTTVSPLNYPLTSSVGPSRPVNLPMDRLLGANSIKPMSPPGMNSSTVPSVQPTGSNRLVNHLPNPSVPEEKPVTTNIASPSRPPLVATIKPVIPPAASPFSASTSNPRLVPSPAEGSSAPQLKSAEPYKVPEICLSNLWKYCKLGNLCPDMHYYLPYRWQIYKGTDWEDISNMEEIEKYYCDPKFDRVQLIDFMTMKSGMHRVRRLSTISSVKKPSDYVLTTEWLWHWKDEFGTWTQYGHSNVKQVNSTILSSDLENVYLSDPTAVIPFSAGNQQYKINFPEMKQRNILYKTEKDVRRRPKFLSFEDVKLLRGSKNTPGAKPSPKSGTSPLKIDIYPKTWDSEAMPDIGCRNVLVSNTSSEFSEIVNSFTKTVSGHVVKNMWRLQNPSLWQVFQWQKEQMKKVNQGRDVKEIRLFHGTEKKHIDAICNDNFDWRICGTHGIVYGQGSYFARDASYSHNYSIATSTGTRMMFVARVLVGEYVPGNPQMKRPPLRHGSITRYYDSCVDNPINPSIFVVFEKHQIYPEYLLEYEEQKKACIVC
ncbi:zinc finger CCCH-type antiviral protein 1-like isoform X2 [Bufo gargarizans]|uniref:zinc finger CCCH-type antiviral protein 1-like isoform X2 n=1 Tax=Bufo gargarizans TaxID=30331 RepID=UPI001CF1DAA5|nr:zinc finger CCCH-type antiviral protein 1-like isoform X2 [Bufo gargarizans]